MSITVQNPTEKAQDDTEKAEHLQKKLRLFERCRVTCQCGNRVLSFHISSPSQSAEHRVDEMRSLRQDQGDVLTANNRRRDSGFQQHSATQQAVL
jgi:hypothetical protein